MDVFLKFEWWVLPASSLVGIVCLSLIFLLLFENRKAGGGIDPFNKKKKISVKRMTEGDLAGVPLADLLMEFFRQKKSGTLAIEFLDRAGFIFFNSGSIVHSKYLYAQGKQALFDLLDLEAGRFHFKPELLTQQTTITEETSHLLLDWKNHREKILMEG